MERSIKTRAEDTALQKGRDTRRFIGEERDTMKEKIKYWALGTIGFWAVIFLANWSWWA